MEYSERIAQVSAILTSLKEGLIVIMPLYPKRPKKASATPPVKDEDTRQIVSKMITDINTRGEEAVLQYSRELDKWDGNIQVGEEEIVRVQEQIPQAVKDDIAYSHDNVQKFAEKQLNSMQEFETELRSGLTIGQIIRPITSAGCYVPGGRYAHIASAIMTITTAKVAGVKSITACSPPSKEQGIDSPAWLITDSESLAQQVLQKVPQYISQLPEDAAQAANKSWKDYGEVVLCETCQEMVKVSDNYTTEHLQAHAADLDWWMQELNNLEGMEAHARTADARLEKYFPQKSFQLKH